MDILQILTSYTPFFKIGNVISDFLRWILWALVSILCNLSDGVEKIVNKIYSLNNFFNKSEIQQIIDKFKPALWVVLTISVLYIGYKLVIDREFKGERIFQNFILSFMVILALPAFMVQMNKITSSAINVANEGIKVEEQTTTARSIIKDNIYDLKYLEKQGFKLNGDLNDSKTKTNNLNPENILRININSTIDRGFLDKEIFKKKIEIDENGKEQVVDLEKSFFGFIEEQYYRFNFNFLTMIIMIICLIVTFVLTSIKIARIIIELGFKKVFAMMLAFGDIASGQKLKTVLKDILSSFGIIFATSILLKLYMVSTTWINTIDANILVKIIFIIASSLMVIDGPNIIERVLGIDAGIKSGWSLVAGAYTGAKTMSSIGSKLGNSMSAVAGGAKGVYDGFNSSTLEDESKSLKDSNSNNDSKTNSSESKSDNNSTSNNLNSNETGRTLSEESQNSQDSNNLSSNEASDNSNLPTNASSEEYLNENSNNISSEYGEASSLSDDMNSNVGSSYKEQETLSDNVNASDNNDLNNEYSKDGVQSSLESENKVNDTSLGNESNKDSVHQSLESEGKASDNSSINDSVSSNTSDSSKGSDSKSISDTEQKPLDSNIKSDNNLNSQSMNDSSNKPVGNSESLKTGKSDKDVVKNSEKLETRGLGQYAKDTLKDSKKGQIAKKHYNLGVNTGKAFRNYMDKKSGKVSK
ncbi:Uncharacterized protein containing DHHC-type Zn finger [[Clostridium] sordellii]|uniref:Membrane protein n=1 Tax=Paraclostridium sordellii TaxID=1505 RepID=A0ABP1XW36_PARSO|nr:hypothetical protein [Paeniclostridium sordellii]TAN66887.1 hypothetical protein WS9_009300 [Paeniclostridium sordellii 8483]CEJ75490.1 putative membrane protein (plasmid) [[Clostridium] sordellii] [Paeniclostridium sordellii]CEN22448.1 Uncharacterized protein containing DHHC-type Zn finger [[Clostridium] sordellii] [Paeniclostridium sordellii]CEN29747.1 Uncharacterized protein containing DHHC-type Zn finger [[Clostridium] sordellii] [Paeniclostridium sordellii]